jgi:hypothetical protein
MPQSDFSRLTIDTVYAANLKFTNYIHSNNVNNITASAGGRVADGRRLKPSSGKLNNGRLIQYRGRHSKL